VIGGINGKLEKSSVERRTVQKHGQLLTRKQPISPYFSTWALRSSPKRGIISSGLGACSRSKSSKRMVCLEKATTAARFLFLHLLVVMLSSLQQEDTRMYEVLELVAVF
jgi:hypothetical protein